MDGSEFGASQGLARMVRFYIASPSRRVRFANVRIIRFADGRIKGVGLTFALQTRGEVGSE